MSWKVSPTMTWNESVWNPSMISTALWLDAADSSTVTTVSGAVSQWNDKSGNARHATQSTSGNRPTLVSGGLNGANTVGFNGSSQFLDSSDFYISDWFMIVVAKTSSTNTIQDFLGKFDGSSNREYLMRFSDQNKLSGLINPVGNAGASNTVVATTASAGTSFGIFGFYKSGASCQLGINGVIETGTFNTSTVFNGTLALRIGSSGIPTYLNGEIQKIVITPTAPSDTIMRKLEGWAAWSTGLTANLPSDHPYKTVGPTP
jgi:hypothetical protein